MFHKRYSNLRAAQQARCVNEHRIFQVQSLDTGRREYVVCAVKDVYEQLANRSICVHEVRDGLDRPCYLTVDIDNVPDATVETALTLAKSLYEECTHAFGPGFGATILIYSTSTPCHFHVKLHSVKPLANCCLCALIAIGSVARVACEVWPYDLHTFATKSNLCVLGFGKSARVKQLVYEQTAVGADLAACISLPDLHKSLVLPEQGTTDVFDTDWQACLSRAKQVRDMYHNVQGIHTTLQQCTVHLHSASHTPLHSSTPHSARSTHRVEQRVSAKQLKLVQLVQHICTRMLQELTQLPHVTIQSVKCKHSVEQPMQFFVPFGSIIVVRTDCATCPWKRSGPHRSNRLMCVMYTNKDKCPVQIRCLSHSHDVECSKLLIVPSESERKQLHQMQLALCG